MKKPKCVFMAASVEYLGHRIDAQGLHPIPNKVEAVKNAPRPKNVTEAYGTTLALQNRAARQYQDGSWVVMACLIQLLAL